MEDISEKYVGGKEASNIIGIHQRTLYDWEKKGKIEVIRTPGGERRYNVSRFMKENGHDDTECIKNLDELDVMEGKLKISYIRVSSMAQKDDLDRQKMLIKDNYPNHILLQDIGSGVNFDRESLKKIIKLAIQKKIEELVVAYKDRLTRIGFNFIESIIKDCSEGKIIVINEKDDMEPEEEISHDILEIMEIFVAKKNSLRKYKKAPESNDKNKNVKVSKNNSQKKKNTAKVKKVKNT